MIINDILSEASTAIVYHYTSIIDARKILQNGVFELSSITGNSSEERLAPKEHPYFFSTTRSKVGDYHRYVGSGGVMFVLDGQWFNRRYRVKPVDYWERSWLHSPERGRESEDRVFSREPTIPIDPIREIHILLKEATEKRSPAARQLMILSYRAGIPTFFYNDEAAWRAQNKSKAVPIKQALPLLKGQQTVQHRWPYHSRLEDWLELVYKKDRKELSKKANDLRKNLVWYNYNNDLNQLDIDLSNARKPDASDRKLAVKLIAYLQKNRLDLAGFVKAMRTKWEALSKD